MKKTVIPVLFAAAVLSGCDLLGIGNKGNEGDIYLGSQTLEVSAEGGSYNISVYCNDDWTAESGASWVYVTQDSYGTDNATVNISPNRPDSEGIISDRETQITFYSGESNVVLTVRQSASSDNTISLSQNEASFGPAGGRLDILVSCTGNWELGYNGEYWVNPSSEDGYNGYTVTFEIGYNSDTETRSTTYTFYCGVAEATLTITQTGDNSESISFKDPYFEEALLYAGADRNMDGKITVEEAASVTELNISDRQIRNMDEIRYFTSLVRLDCSRSNLEGFPDFSSCTKLEELVCDRCGLNSIDLGTCPQLKRLSCEINSPGTIDLSSVPELEYLQCNNCKLTSLDLSGNPLIKDVYATSNGDLTEVNLTGCRQLETVSLGNSALTSLELSGYPVLENVYVGNCILQSLILRDCPSLTYISCESNSLNTLVTDNCPSLERIFCYDNDLTSLDIVSDKMWQIECGSNAMTGLDLSGCPNLEDLSCENNKMTSLDVTGLSLLQTLDCSSNSISELDLTNNRDLESLDCGENGKMTVRVYRYHTIRNFGSTENDDDITVVYVDEI